MEDKHLFIKVIQSMHNYREEYMVIIKNPIYDNANDFFIESNKTLLTVDIDNNPYEAYYEDISDNILIKSCLTSNEILTTPDNLDTFATVEMLVMIAKHMIKGECDMDIIQHFKIAMESFEFENNKLSFNIHR